MHHMPISAKPARGPPALSFDNGAAYQYPWQKPKNPITGDRWYTASGEPPPPLHNNRRVVAPIGHPHRYDYYRDEPESSLVYPNAHSLFCHFSPFDLD